MRQGRWSLVPVNGGSGSLVAIGQTPQTETLWYGLVAVDAGDRPVVATRVLTRFAKASSPLHADRGA